MSNIVYILRTQMLKVTRNMGLKILYLLNSPFVDNERLKSELKQK